MNPDLDPKILTDIDELVKHFVAHEEAFLRARNSLQGYISLSKKLTPYIHTIKSRLKDPTHLKDKLVRKANDAKSKNLNFDITKDNLFLKINDLAGFRIIHLHTRQIEYIDKYLKEIFREENVEILEGPEAKTWDDEFSGYFQSLGFTTVRNPNMYTSIHYIVKPSPIITCEIQVRTLMEEVWGEVDHLINYPHKTESISCRDQIKVLARSTSSCSRLVDCIFATHAEYEEKNTKAGNIIQRTANKPSR
jgi:putative GTP pyrophosphokinase